MGRYKTVFTTERGHRHQQAALAVAPDLLDITMLRRPDSQTLQARLADAEYLISERTGVVDAEILRAAPKLKLILRLGSLTYDIDTEAARAAGVAVCYWPMGSVIRVAEHVILQLLALAKKLRETEAIALAADPEWGESRRTDEDTFAYNWSQRQDVDQLWLKSIGILGFGEIGAELARRLQGWGCTLLYNKRRRLPEKVEAALGLTHVEANALFAQSDYVVNLLPHSPNTDLMLDACCFAQMKQAACLVSCGSGSVIHELDLAEAIRSGKLAGAALDTFEWEPLQAHNPLIALAQAGYNVLLTPHTAAGAIATSAQERQRNYTNILNHIQDKPLLYRIV
jgi:phosphoglycerate dehydrogenase-like enzyme